MDPFWPSFYRFPAFPAFPRLDFDTDQDFSKLRDELNKAKTGDDEHGHSYFKSTFTTRTGDGVKTHEVKSYKTPDGRQIIKELKQLGNQKHETTKVKGSGADADESVTVNTTVESKALEDFMNAFDAEPAPKMAIEDAKAKELRELKNQMQALQDRIQSLEKSGN